MIVGIPLEAKVDERRVALLPDAAKILAAAGHEVRVQAGAGAGVGFADEAYREAGARIVDAAQAWDVPLVVKVKELQPADFALVRREGAVFSFHHLPGEAERTRELARHGVTAIAFEMLRDARGGFPLLAPMSEIAGRLAVERGAALATGPLRDVLVLGAGHAGLAAARTARERGARVTVLTRSTRTHAELSREGLAPGLATPEAVERHALAADLVVGAVFVPAQPTPTLLPRALVRRMKRGAVIVDVSIDAGGVAETSRPTSHTHPTYVEEGVVHYAVPNMPAAVPAEAAAAISAAALPYVLRLAGGLEAALRGDPLLAGAVLLWKGAVADRGIAAEAQLPYTPFP